MRRLNVVLLVVDSLRARSLGDDPADRPATPFLDGLAASTIAFRRAHATECWTLPTHMSMFTGLLPSEHGAHFQSMDYVGSAPTIAEILSAAGYFTEVVTRNTIFDGSLPGVTRGFAENRLVLSERSGGWNPVALGLALTKPRFRRQVRASGFFHPLQREQRDFLRRFSRAMMPADHETLAIVRRRMVEHRRARRPYFLFANLYDVHAPYPPNARSIFRRWDSLAAAGENLTMPFLLPYLGGHAYLREGFALSARSRRLLLGRYHDAIQLMDAKLAHFFARLRGENLLDDTLVILTSDHGEAFGDHGLYLHDASVYQTHLHVPLYVHHPGLRPHAIDDVVSTRDLFGLMRAAASGTTLSGTILDPSFRGEHPIAFAEHFHYPHARRMAPEFRQNLSAAVTATHKLIQRRDGARLYDLRTDPDERHPDAIGTADLAAILAATGVGTSAADDAAQHVAFAASA